MSQKEYIFVDCETGVFEKKCTGGKENHAENIAILW